MTPQNKGDIMLTATTKFALAAATTATQPLREERHMDQPITPTRSHRRNVPLAITLTIAGILAIVASAFISNTGAHLAGAIFIGIAVVLGGIAGRVWRHGTIWRHHHR